MKFMWLHLILLLIILTACSNKRQKQESAPENELGQYLYITDNRVLHTRTLCLNVIDAKDNKGHKVSGMKFVDTLYFCNDNNLRYCIECFVDSTYEHVKRIATRNRQKPLYVLYRRLKHDYDDMPDDYSEFEESLTREWNSSSNRHRLYDLLKGQYDDVPESYAGFYSTLFVPISKEKSRAKYADEFVIRLNFWTGL